jgi:hypothetical protein
VGPYGIGIAPPILAVYTFNKPDSGDLMEARKLGTADDPHSSIKELCELDQPFSWHALISLVHPHVWAVIAALWIGIACLLLYEAG